MHICHSLADVYDWHGLFGRFLEEHLVYYFALIVLVGAATFLDRGRLSWALGLALGFSLIVMSGLQYELARALAHIRTGQFGGYCHSDVVDQEVMNILRFADGGTTFYLQFLYNALFTTLTFWFAFLVVRRRVRKDVTR